MTDKGPFVLIVVVAATLAVCSAQDSQVRLLLVGPDEEGLLPEIEQACANCRSRLHVAGFSAFSVPMDFSRL